MLTVVNIIKDFNLFLNISLLKDVIWILKHWNVVLIK
jgi:hypothetical protein